MSNTAEPPRSQPGMKKSGRSFGTERELAHAVGRELRGGLERPAVGSVKLRSEVPSVRGGAALSHLRGALRAKADLY
jgi:hypothetical protein